MSIFLEVDAFIFSRGDELSNNNNLKEIVTVKSDQLT